MATKGVNAKNMRAIDGGKNRKGSKSQSNHGKIKGASKAPLPSYKKSKGTGIAGRGTGV